MFPNQRFGEVCWHNRESGVQSTLFCIFDHCYFISSPNKLKICRTIKQLYIHNIMPKHKNNALQKKFYNQFKKGTFSVECAPCTGHTRHEHGVHLTSQKKLACMHCIMFMWYPMYSRHLLTASPLLSPSNYPLSLHSKKNLMIIKHSMKPVQYAEIHALLYKYNVPLSTQQT